MSKKKIGHFTWFFLLFGAILPDADFLLDWTLGTEYHRTFTHSLMFVFTASLVVYAIFSVVKHQEKKYFAIAIAVGIISHLLLDMFISQGVPLFWPSLTYFSYTHIGFYDPQNPSFLHASELVLKQMMKLALFDMALGVTWLFYLWCRQKIEF